MTKIVYLNDEHAQVSKRFAKNAKVFGSEEYLMWKEYRMDFPKAIMVVKEIKKNHSKKTNRNMTYENMKIYISEHANKDVMLNEFARQLKISKIKKNPYRYVLSWFDKFYPSAREYLKEDREDKTEAKKEAVAVEEQCQEESVGNAVALPA